MILAGIRDAGPPLARGGVAAARWLWRHPWRAVAVAVAILVIFPPIDLTVSSWFFDPAQKVFVARVWPPAEWVRRAMPYFLFAVAGYVLILWICGEVMGQIFMGVTRRVALFLLGSLALGPGLVVNVLLKDNWGRARPSTVHQFGGPDTFSPALVLSDQCSSNCSFPSGHASLGFWVLAFALLAPRKWRGWAVAAAVAFGSMVGLVRIAQGGHFLSDVVCAAIITIAIIRWLYLRLVVPVEWAPLKKDSSVRRRGAARPYAPGASSGNDIQSD